MSERQVKVFDAANAVVGRLAAKAAKAALLGDTVVIINAEKAVITGDRRTVIDAYKARQKIRTSYNPRKGPFHPKRPDTFVRRVVRGMLPWPKPRGKAAYKRVRVYIGVPDEYAEVEPIVLEGAQYRSLKMKRITVGELCHELGWRNPMEEV